MWARVARVLKKLLTLYKSSTSWLQNEKNHHYISKFVTKNNRPSFLFLPLLFLLLSKDTGQNEKRNKREIRWNSSFPSTDRTDLAKVKDRIVLNATCGYCSSSCLFLCGSLLLFRGERWSRAHAFIKPASTAGLTSRPDRTRRMRAVQSGQDRRLRCLSTYRQASLPLPLPKRSSWKTSPI